MGQTEHHRVNHSQLWVHQKQKEPFIRTVVSCAISCTMRPGVCEETTVKELKNQSGTFENTANKLFEIIRF